MSVETLKKLSSFAGRKGPLLFIVMDGIGLGRSDDSNAVHLAKTPIMDELQHSKLYTQLKTHGTAVGLPSDDDMGNSEVGHNAIGAGRIFDQGAKLVNHALETGELFQSNVWKDILQRGRDGKTIHFIGLLSDGNVHSHINHLLNLLDRCAQEKIPRVCIHVLLDGRDVPQRSALTYLSQLENHLIQIPFDYQIASGGGRMKVTMDRYNADWEIVKRGWDAHVRGIGRKFQTAKEAVETFYREDDQIIDQYLDSFVIVNKEQKPIGKILDGDAVVFFNFRGDRAIEISRAFEEKNFSEFNREDYPDVFFAGMLLYDGDLHVPKHYLVDPPAIDHPMAEYMCQLGITSFAISETQKYGHVTYFWNGNRSGFIDKHLETFIEIPSDKIPFDQKPKMKALEITEKTIEILQSGKYKFGRINFPNGDMVGHTGNMKATISACECVDECIGKILTTMEKLGGITIITADHGNADEMYFLKNGTKIPKTSHTLNLVPFTIVDPAYRNEYDMAKLPHPGLANIAATIFNLLGYEKPADYEPSLIQFNQ